MWDLLLQQWPGSGPGGVCAYDRTYGTWPSHRREMTFDSALGHPLAALDMAKLPVLAWPPGRPPSDVLAQLPPGGDISTCAWHGGGRRSKHRLKALLTTACLVFPRLPSCHRCDIQGAGADSNVFEMGFLPEAKCLVHILPPLVVLWIAAGFLAYCLFASALPKPLPGIPYNMDSSKRLFGDLAEIRQAIYRRQWIWSQPREHGAPVSQAFLFPFRRPTVIISDYRTAVDICSRRTKEFDRGTRNRECVGITAPNFHFTMQSSDPRFRCHRELLRDLMTPWFLKEACQSTAMKAQLVAAPRVYDKAALLVDLWGLKLSKAQGRPFSATHDLYLATLDMISSVAFGMEASQAALTQEILHARFFSSDAYRAPNEPAAFPAAPANPEIEALLDIPEMVAIAQGSPFPALAQWLALLQPKHARAHWHRRSLLRRQTMRSLHRLALLGEKSVPESALDQLLLREKMAASRMGREPDFYSPAIRDEVLGYLLGGHDSTATVLAWWVKHMTRHQEVQLRLRQALLGAHFAACAEGRWPTMQEICSTSIPYLDAVLEESLRCASVATLIVRKATCNTHILGYPIPEGTDIIIPLTGPSMTEPALPIPESLRSEACRSAPDRVPAWGDDIGEYRPERWLKYERNAAGGEAAVFDAQAGPTLAFSTGPRKCFGKKQGEMQLKMTATLLLWNYAFEPVGEPLDGWEITERLVNLPKNCYVKLRKL
ncbi:putative cytochrome P450 312a1 [Tolypocladium ophioglossoides CBS 100239]|uniref:Putative cytochrome P450 312a1 n=1 Tax=Tolypocladium ophioglossoides (strain CBS 100239) TaxID=1163406 RepID=A0A0L0MY03_TOLOC|nr:putative cytochrome P450 312a1 [Tolypocladium ophioglossoides CBS 100239]